MTSGSFWRLPDEVIDVSLGGAAKHRPFVPAAHPFFKLTFFVLQLQLLHFCDCATTVSLGDGSDYLQFAPWGGEHNDMENCHRGVAGRDDS